MGTLLAGLACLLSGAAGAAEEEGRVANWTAPPYWTGAGNPAGEERGDRPSASGRTPEGRSALAIGPTALPFIALPPCRIVDTRAPVFPAPLGGGFLPAATVRSYTVTGVCGIPANAQGLSLNATVVHPVGPGFLTLWPQGGAYPPVSTLNYLGNDVIVNAAVVPLSGAGGISMSLGVSGGDVILDTNGYYATVPAVNSLNTQTGDLTLVPGTNVTITPGAGTLTIAATAGGGGVTSVAGTNGISASPSTGAVTVTSNATSGNFASTIVARNGAGSFDATSVVLAGFLSLTATTPSFNGAVLIGGNAFLHGLGSRNTFVGTSSGNPVMTVANATDNTGVGFSSLFRMTTGAYNSAFGAGALAFNTSGASNSAFGQNALDSNDVGGGNSAFGRGALAFNTNGNGNQAFGVSALQNNTSGSANAAFGQFALQNNSTGGNNTAFGNSALQNNSVSNSSAFGTSALRFNTTGTDNSAFGFNALTSNSTGNSNSAFGREALTNNNANLNSAFGSLAATLTASGCCNSAFGWKALPANVSGSQNTAIGRSSLLFSTGSNNTALGSQALAGLSTGNGNIGIGYFAGVSVTSGSNGIYIGSDAPGDESNVIRIGGGQTAAFISGIYGAAIGGSGLAVSVSSSGQLGTTSSSRRYKEEIVDIGDESDVLMQLRPVTYFYKPELDPTHTRQYGLIAEEVAELAPGLVALDKDGRIETVRYPLVNAMLLNEVQKSRRMIDELRADRDALQRRLDALEQKLSRVVEKRPN